MHPTRRIGIATTTLALALTATPLLAQEEARSIEDGGIHVSGWMGMPDEGSVESARLAMDGDALHVTTGPAITYWNPANTASGTYTVTATFREPAFMNLNNHPHPYGIVIAGNDLGTDRKSYLYCAAYGNGQFIVRGFGPEPFALNGRRAEENPAVHRAAGQGEPVTQEIAVSVTDDAVQCAINGEVVASYPKADLVTEGRLTSTDGNYGIRFGHNTEALVTGLSVTGGM
ncbi:MAG: hypothetical protein PVI57_03650 [Gemmatimonadota bacterium]|jgi:hypothetical protein